NIDQLVDLLGRWASGRGPLYLLLATRLRVLIDDGVLPPGALLPPDRVLARRLAVGRGTVVAAYELLQREGRVLRRQGSGTRVAEVDLPSTRTADGVTANPLLLHILHPPDGVTLLTCAAPDEPPPELAEAYEAAAGRLAGMRDLGSQPAGQPDVRAAVAADYRRRRPGATAEGSRPAALPGSRAATPSQPTSYKPCGNAPHCSTPSRPRATPPVRSWTAPPAAGWPRSPPSTTCRSWTTRSARSSASTPRRRPRSPPTRPASR